MLNLNRYYHHLTYIKNYSTVTDLLELTLISFISFTISFKIDKKGNMIDGEYGNFDIVFIER